MIHACLGWKKVTPVLGIPRGHIARVEILGTWVEVSQILSFFNVKWIELARLCHHDHHGSRVHQLPLVRDGHEAI